MTTIVLWRLQLRVIKRKNKYIFYDDDGKIIIITCDRKLGKRYILGGEYGAIKSKAMGESQSQS